MRPYAFQRIIHLTSREGERAHRENGESGLTSESATTWPVRACVRQKRAYISSQVSCRSWTSMNTKDRAGWPTICNVPYVDKTENSVGKNGNGFQIRLKNAFPYVTLMTAGMKNGLHPRDNLFNHPHLPNMKGEP